MKSISSNSLSNTKLLSILLCLQFAMCLILVVFINSAWYSKFFNLRLREMLADTYKHSDPKDPRLLQKALSYSAKSGEPNIEDLDLLEELSLSEAELARTGQSNKVVPTATVSKLVKDATQQLHKRSARDKVSKTNFAICKKKELRVHVAQAKLALRNSNLAEAAKQIEESRSVLRTMPPIGDKQRMILDYVICSEILARKRSDAARAENYHAMIAGLRDPAFAKSWYLKNGASGYDLDYSPEYISLYDLAQMRTATGGAKKKSIEDAIENCSKKNIPRSIAASVLLTACQQVITLDDLALKKRVLASWFLVQGQNKPKVDEEGQVMPLILPMAELMPRDRKISLAALTQFINCFESGLLKIENNQYILIDYYGQLDMLGLLPFNESEAAELLQLSQRARKLAQSHKLSTADIILAEALALAELKRADEAEKLAIDFLKEPTTKDELRAPENGGIFRIAFGSIANGLQEKYGKERRLKFCNAVLADPRWAPDNKFEILLPILELDKHDPQISREHIECLAQLLRSKTLTKRSLDSANNVLLRYYCWDHQFDKAEALYHELKKQYSSQPEKLAELCLDQIGWLRAFPSYTDEGHTRGIQKKYPDEMIRDGALLADRFFAKDAEKLSRYKLMLAEYEVCRDDKAAALKLVSELVQNEKYKPFASYLAAQALESELSGKPSKIPVGKIKAPKGSKIEIGCLWSLLYTSKNFDSSNRVKGLESRIEED